MAQGWGRDDEVEDFDDTSNKTKWAILIDTKRDDPRCVWMITQMSLATEVGEYELDIAELERKHAARDPDPSQ